MAGISISFLKPDEYLDLVALPFANAIEMEGGEPLTDREKAGDYEYAPFVQGAVTILPKGTYTAAVGKTGGLPRFKELLGQLGVPDIFYDAVHYMLKAIDGWRDAKNLDDGTQQISAEDEDEHSYSALFERARELGCPDTVEEGDIWNSWFRDGLRAYARSQKIELVESTAELQEAAQRRDALRASMNRRAVAEGLSGMTQVEVEQARQEMAAAPNQPDPRSAVPPARVVTAGPANYLHIEADPNHLRQQNAARARGEADAAEVVRAMVRRRKGSETFVAHLRERFERFVRQKNERLIREFYRALVNPASRLRQPFERRDSEVWYLTHADAAMLIGDLHGAASRCGFRL
jgi:hypothetical protein